MQSHTSHTNPHMKLFEACSYLLWLQHSASEEKQVSLANYGLELLKSLQLTLAFFKQKCPFFRGNTKFWRTFAGPKLPKFSFLPFFFFKYKFPLGLRPDSVKTRGYLFSYWVFNWMWQFRKLNTRQSVYHAQSNQSNNHWRNTCRMLDNCIIIKLSKINVYLKNQA